MVLFLLPSVVDVFSMLGIFMVKYLLFKRECDLEGIFKAFHFIQGALTLESSHT